MNLPDEAPQRSVEQWIKEQEVDTPTPALSLVIPAYNEYRRLPVMLMEAIDYLDGRVAAGLLKSYEIIVVDDGSIDQTAELVGKFEKIRRQVALIRLPRNYGKGHAVRLGMLNAHGERLLFADADGASPIAELDRLWRAIDQGAAVAFGSRAMASRETKVSTTWMRKYPGRLFNFLVNMLVLPNVSDSQCGFKMFTRTAARFLFERQQCDGWAFDVELLYIARRAGLRAVETPINWNNVPGSKVNLFTDSLRMLKDIIVFRMRHRGVTPQQFTDSQATADQARV